jgi:peptidoglycan/LPS O-acetylase OafA/YrhL
LTVEFMMGVVVGLLWTKRWVPGALGAGVVGFAALVLVIFYLAPTFSLAALPHFDVWRVVAFGLPSALILYALAASELRRPQRPPSLLVALGDWSYSTYLVHVPVMAALARLILMVVPGGGAGASLVLIVGGFILANVAGAMTSILFERPTLRWLHRIGPPAPAVVPAP